MRRDTLHVFSTVGWSGCVRFRVLPRCPRRVVPLDPFWGTSEPLVVFAWPGVIVTFSCLPPHVEGLCTVSGARGAFDASVPNRSVSGSRVPSDPPFRHPGALGVEGWGKRARIPLRSTQGSRGSFPGDPLSRPILGVPSGGQGAPYPAEHAPTRWGMLPRHWSPPPRVVSRVSTRTTPDSVGWFLPFIRNRLWILTMVRFFWGGDWKECMSPSISTEVDTTPFGLRWGLLGERLPVVLETTWMLSCLPTPWRTSPR